MIGKMKLNSLLFGTRALALLVGIGVVTSCPAAATPNNAPQTQNSNARPDSSVTLDSASTILVSPDEPGPIQQAAKDLQSDFGKVFGKTPRIVTRPQDAAATTILVGEYSKLSESVRPAPLTAPESFSISVAHPSGPRAATIVLAGADMRGTIYAIYQFSEQHLGIDPLYYWTDHEPEHRAEIQLAANLSEQFPAPVFKYRGFFINDEDLLTGWAPGEKKDHTGISLDVWNKVFETILRLKGNMVAPGTWIFPDDPQVKLAGERGLILTQHHAIPLGLNVARWPKDVPYSYTEHPEILERAWKDAVAAYPHDQEVLWTVGLRGLSDASYAAFDPSVRGNDKALGELITKAIADQMQIVRAQYPDAKFITSLWQEGARLVQEGYLKIPPEVGTVWADTGYGYLQDKGLVTAGQGAYYHDAMMNGMANQLTEMVPVERIDSELGRYIKAGATNYLLLNTSDIRPVSMTAKAIMDIAWKGMSSDAGQSDSYYRRWSSDEFGSKAASQVAEIYKEYFDAPAHRPGGEPALEYGDNYYQTEARRFLLDYMVQFPLYSLPGQAPTWQTPRVVADGSQTPGMPNLADSLKAEIQRCDAVQPKWDALWEKAVAAEPLVSADRRDFYQADVLTMIAIGRESNRMLSLVAQAVQDAEAGKTEDSLARADQALAAFDEIFKNEKASEYGKWKNWYRGDWLTGIPRTRELLENFKAYLADPLSPMPPPINWANWEAYYHIMHYEGARSADVN